MLVCLPLAQVSQGLASRSLAYAAAAVYVPAAGETGACKYWSADANGKEV
jgi:hypothetical protein